MSAIGPRIDLGKLIDDPNLALDGAPAILRRSDGKALLYERSANLLCGLHGSGKTWLALQALVEVAEGSCPAWMFDYESGPEVTARRLAALRLSSEDAERIHYHVLNGPLTEEDRSKLGREVEKEFPYLIVIDSVAEAIAAQGLDENSASDTARWFSEIVRPLTRKGCAVLLLDHVAKDREGRGSWARGSGHKLAMIDGAAYGIEVKEPWHRGGPGSAELVILKDRNGHVGGHGSIAANMRVNVLEGGQRVIITLNPSSVDNTAPPRGAGKNKRLSPHDVVDRLADSGGRWMNRDEAAKALGFGKAATRAAIDEAVSAGLIVEQKHGRVTGYRLAASDELDVELQELVKEEGNGSVT
jgi:hypothetical protein